jgi:hypothetical protein
MGPKATDFVFEMKAKVLPHPLIKKKMTSF